MHGNADGARLIGNAARDRLADPPGRISAELIAAAILELVHRLHQANIPFLDEIKELQAAVSVFLGDGDDEAQIGLHHFFLGDAGFAFAFLYHVHDATKLGERHAGCLADFGNFGADTVYRIDFVFSKRPPLFVEARNARHPTLVELAADIAIEKILTVHLVPFGQPQHLAAERGEAAVEAVKLIDQIFDLGLVKLNAFDFGGQLFAQFLIFALVARGQLATCRHRIEATGLHL